ncbi:hypothetical protein AB6A40_001677 [Gnathostoma spinigerum]|uniref:Uncharacterized protein n=1 Tax=Gnathostoma spinigerum TaxID=75299 RepID=A0ABD6EDP3_9BILA
MLTASDFDDDSFEISAQNREAVEAIRRMIGQEAAADPYCTPFNLLRWIIAYEYNLEEVAKKVKRHLQIRKIKHLDRVPTHFEDLDKVISTYAPITIVGRNKKDDNKVAFH